MKTMTASTTAGSADPVPDFSGRPLRINLDQILAVKGHGKIVIRPIEPHDEEEMIRFHENLSEESIYLRYFEYLGLDRRTEHERLSRICRNTSDSYAIVVERCQTAHQSTAILAVGRLTTVAGSGVASFDTLVASEKNEAQLRKLLLNRLMKLAKAFGFHLLTGELLVADHDALNLCRALDFSLQTQPLYGTVRVTYQL